QITIIERAVFPRAKVCGEFISPAATSILENIIPESELLRAAACRIGTTTLSIAGSKCTWPMPRPAWALRPASLDRLLLARASDPGAQALQPQCVKSVAYHEGRVNLSLTRGGGLDAEIVIHADGSGRHDPSGSVPSASSLIALKCHLQGGVPPGACM